jgi:hypothetical protein
LRGQVATAKAEREAIEARAKAATDEAAKKSAEAATAKAELAKAHTELAEVNVSAVDSAIAAAKAELASLQRDQRVAYENSDFEKVASINAKMAEQGANLAVLNQGKQDLEIRRAEAETRAKETPATSTADPFESAIAGAGPMAKQWLRAHPQYVTDDRMRHRASAADSLARAEGLTPETPEYFDFCERQLGLKTDPTPQPKPTPARTPSMPAAPVSRSDTPTGGNLTPTQVSLTPGEQRAALETIVWNYTDPKVGAVKGQPVGLKEYARRKMLMQKEGRYGVLSDS